MKMIQKVFSKPQKIYSIGRVEEAPKVSLIDGRLYRRPVELANLQLDYFIQKVDKLTSRFRNNNTNPLRWLIPAMNKWEGKGTFPKFIFEELTLEKVSQLISDLGNSSSMGTDSIDARAFKYATSILAPPIKHIINVSLRTSTYANCWKLSKLVPLLKSKDLNKLSPSAYRPIAIMPALSKIVEKAAQTQLLNFFEKNKLLNDCTHAYRKGYSTTTTLLDITDKLYSAIDNKKISSIMTIDQSAAFDCVSHTILIDKLWIYNIDEKALSWLTSYLEYRTQFVTIGRARSRMGRVSIGVPQGSVLGPLLYSIYTNEMSEAVNDSACTDSTHQNSLRLFPTDCLRCGTITQYADDATYVVSSIDRIRNQQKLSENIENLRTFLETNELTINADKTNLVKVMIQQKRAKTRGNPPDLIVRNNVGQLETVSDRKYCRILGMNLQNNMTLNDHLETGKKSLLPSLRKNLGALKNLGKQIPQGSRNTMARGIILSRLSYLIGIWSGATEHLMKKAQIVQNSAVRWVTGCARKTRITTLLNKNWMELSTGNGYH